MRLTVAPLLCIFSQQFSLCRYCSRCIMWDVPLLIVHRHPATSLDRSLSCNSITYIYSIDRILRFLKIHDALQLASRFLKQNGLWNKISLVFILIIISVIPVADIVVVTVAIIMITIIIMMALFLFLLLFVIEIVKDKNRTFPDWIFPTIPSNHSRVKSF